jgi:hypothetical protein
MIREPVYEYMKKKAVKELDRFFLYSGKSREVCPLKVFSGHDQSGDLPHTAEAVGFSLHLAWQPTSIHDGFVQALVILV